jgi:dTMP kinase
LHQWIDLVKVLLAKILTGGKKRQENFMSLFVTFEGGEGSGKSTQARLLYQKLVDLAVPVLLVHEPGTTALGEKVTYLLKWAREVAISPLTELFLFNASRAQLVSEVIGPALINEQVVVCDRFTDSTVAYQGYGRGLDIEIIRKVNRFATGDLKPNLTVLVNTAVRIGLERKKERRDRFEGEALAFHCRVRSGFLEIAAGEPGRFLVVDGTQTKKKVAEIIWQRVRGLLPGKPMS